MLVANIGDSPAAIDSFGLAIYFGEGASPSAEPVPHPTQMIPLGKWLNVDGEGPIFSAIASAAFNQGTRLNAVGIINYRDRAGIVRATGFARVYDSGRRRFVPVPDTHPESDREYED
jgi:hypothetical protein